MATWIAYTDPATASSALQSRLLQAGATLSNKLNAEGIMLYALANFMNTDVAGQYFAPTGQTAQTVTYATTMTPNLALGNYIVITATDTVAFTIANPTNPTTGSTVIFRLCNASGGTIGTATWGAAFKTPSITKAATGSNRSHAFFYDGTAYYQLYSSPGDIAN